MRSMPKVIAALALLLLVGVGTPLLAQTPNGLVTTVEYDAQSGSYVD